MNDPRGDNKNDLSSETLVNALRCTSKSGSDTTMSASLINGFSFSVCKLNELILKWLDMPTFSLCTYVVYPLVLWILEMQR